MYCNVDGELFRFRVEVSWSEVATFQVASVAPDIQLDMIVSG